MSHGRWLGHHFSLSAEHASSPSDARAARASSSHVLAAEASKVGELNLPLDFVARERLEGPAPFFVRLPIHVRKAPRVCGAVEVRAEWRFNAAAVNQCVRVHGRKEGVREHRLLICGAGAEALGLVLAEQLAEEVQGFPCELRLVLARPKHLPVTDARGDGQCVPVRRGRGAWRATHEELKDERPQAPPVGCGARSPAAPARARDHLRTHVLHCAKAGHRALLTRIALRVAPWRGHWRQGAVIHAHHPAQVDEAWPAVVIERHILRLDIPESAPQSVQRSQAHRHCTRVKRDGRVRERAALAEERVQVPSEECLCEQVEPRLV
mmetsp:Transcript_22791/g.61781  ORF Transcript_22791/g.61781 Transcript_22791/m.61781 type:complete len:323 (+) Transcript_22791:242-1210(+)